MKQFTLLQKFSLYNLLALLVVAFVFGWIVTYSLEHNALSRSYRLTANIITESIQNEFTPSDFSQPKIGQEYSSFSKTIDHISLGPDIEQIKIWNKEMVVIWATSEQLVGEQFLDNDDLVIALSGEIVPEYSRLEKSENEFEGSFDRLLELYVPVQFDGESGINVVVEIYKNLDPLYEDISQNRLTVWISILVGFSLLFILLFGIVKRASRRIEEQTSEIIKSEERFRVLVESAQDAIISITLNGDIILFNRAASMIFGYAIEEVTGHSVTMLMSEKYRDRHTLGLERFNDSGQQVLIGKTVEIEGLRKNQQVFPLELSLATSGKGDDQIVTGILRDISERKKIQTQLMMSDRLASIGKLVSGVAHELNNPMTSIIGFSDLLLAQNLSDDVKQDVEIINKEAKRTAEIVKGLLTFARKQKIEKEPVDINKVIQAVLDLRAYEQKLNNIEVNTHLPADLPEIIANASQLRQVFLNLVVNAEQAMLEAHNKGILTIATEQVGDIVKVSLADDGPGIPEENLKQLFDPFFTTKEEGKGTGLGLSISHGIIADHGGLINAENNDNGGATFTMELPINAGA